MISVRGRRRGRPFLIAILPLFLVGSVAVLVLQSAEAEVDEHPAILGGLQAPPPATDEPGAWADPDLQAQIRAWREETAPGKLEFHQHPNGAVSVDLDRRFAKLTVVTVDSQGRVRTTCLDGDSVPAGGEAASSGQER